MGRDVRKDTCRNQAANLKGFRASVNPRFEAGILEFMDGIPDFMEKFQYILMCYIET